MPCDYCTWLQCRVCGTHFETVRRNRKVPLTQRAACEVDCRASRGARGPRPRTVGRRAPARAAGLRTSLRIQPTNRPQVSALDDSRMPGDSEQTVLLSEAEVTFFAALPQLFPATYSLIPNSVQTSTGQLFRLFRSFLTLYSKPARRAVVASDFPLRIRLLCHDGCSYLSVCLSVFYGSTAKGRHQKRRSLHPNGGLTFVND